METEILIEPTLGKGETVTLTLLSALDESPGLQEEGAIAIRWDDDGNLSIYLDRLDRTAASAIKDLRVFDKP